jgi:hypothetical protein
LPAWGTERGRLQGSGSEGESITQIGARIGIHDTPM